MMAECALDLNVQSFLFLLIFLSIKKCYNGKKQPYGQTNSLPCWSVLSLPLASPARLPWSSRLSRSLLMESPPSLSQAVLGEASRTRAASPSRCRWNLRRREHPWSSLCWALTPRPSCRPVLLHPRLLPPLPITRNESIGSLLRPRRARQGWLRTAHSCQSFLSFLISTCFPGEEGAIRDSQRSAAILNAETHFSSSAFRSLAKLSGDFKSQHPFRIEVSIYQ